MQYNYYFFKVIVMDCIFCKIIAGDIPSKKIYEDDKILAFHDIEPQAPTHAVIIPKEHIESANALNADNADIVSYIFTKIPEIAKTLGLEKGYRVVNNCGPDAGQTVFHIHFHLMGGDVLGKMA